MNQQTGKPGEGFTTGAKERYAEAQDCYRRWRPARRATVPGCEAFRTWLEERGWDVDLQVDFCVDDDGRVTVAQ